MENKLNNEQFELNNALFEACVKEEIDLVEVETLLKAGARPLGLMADENGAGSLVYSELIFRHGDRASDDSGLLKLTELFLRYGMDIGKPDVPYGDINIISPLEAFICNGFYNSAMHSLRLILDSGFNTDDALNCIKRILSDISFHDVLDENGADESLEYSMLQILLFASYPQMLENEWVRSLIWYSENDRDTEKFRDHLKFSVDFDVTHCTDRIRIDRSIAVIKERYTGKEVWRFGIGISPDELNDTKSFLPKEEIKRVYKYNPSYDANRTVIMRYLDWLEIEMYEGEYFVFETDSYFIRLGSDGISVFDSADEFDTDESGFYPVSDSPDDYYDDDEPFTGFEDMLFVGEKIVGMEFSRAYGCLEERDALLIRFTDFDARIVGIKSFGELKISQNLEIGDSIVPFCSRHLTKRCACGGEAEVVTWDLIGDFLVRCSKCHAATWAYSDIKYAIDDWNSGHIEINCVLGHESFEKIKKIDRIFVYGDYYMLDDNLLMCSMLNILAGKKSFLIQPGMRNDGQDGLIFSALRPNNYDNFREIKGENIELVGFEDDEFSTTLRIVLDDTYLCVHPDMGELDVYLTSTIENEDGEETTLPSTREELFID